MFEQLEQKQPCISLTFEEFFVNETYTRGEQFYSSRSLIIIHIAADTYHRHKCRSNSTHYKKTVGWPPLKKAKQKVRQLTRITCYYVVQGFLSVVVKIL